MSYVPEDTKWYLADLVVEITVENDTRNTVHINTVLVRADSPDEAYNRALELGVEENISYENPEGNNVEIKFRGLKNLFPIYDELEHGAELFYGEEFQVPEKEIQKMICPKEKLGVFSPVVKEDKPNYLAKDIYDSILKAGFTKDQLK